MPHADAPGTTAPRATKIPRARTHHGDTFIDDYEWLRDKDNPEVIALLEAENAYTDERLAPLAGLRETIFDEIKSRVKETDLSLPVREDGWWYYSRSFEGKQYGVSCRAPISGPDDWTPPVIDKVDADRPALPGEIVLFDSNVEAEGHEFFSVGGLSISEDDRWLAYAIDTEGDERYTLRVRSLETGEELPEVIENTAGGGAFSRDGEYLFYETVDDAWRPDTVWRHRLGTDPSDDFEVFHENDERFWVGLGLTRSKRYLVIELGSKITSETWLIPDDDPTAVPEVVWPRREGVEYGVEHAVVDGEDRLLILHNDGALNFELVDVPVADTAAVPRLLLPHDPAVRLEDVDAFADRLVIEYRREGLTRLGVVELDEAGSDASHEGLAPGMGPLREIPFDEPLYSVGLGASPEWSQPTLRIGYGSMVTPGSVYEYTPATGALRLLKQQSVLGGYDPALYEQRREWATADDGTRVPLSLVWRTDLVKTGGSGPSDPAPVLLYGYGAYEHSTDPGFSVPRLSLLDRGVVFAVAHVRGGGELGRHWYDDGKGLAKRNSFTDFAASARHLVDTGWTTPERMVAEGGSAGGLLVGAALNIAPELFAGVLADVPFVDALTSILDPSLPLTVVEWDEWGDPLHDPSVYAYMKSYAPYENVRDDVVYPPVLAVTSLNDTRVLYVEPAKWVQRLRDAGHDALLKIEMVAGHGGVSGRYSAWRDRAFELAWVLDRLGLGG